MTKVTGVGAKKAWSLFRTWGIRSFAELVEACDAGLFNDEEKLVANVRLAQKDAGRIVWQTAYDLYDAMAKSFDERCYPVLYAGSLRRKRADVGDIDVLIYPEKVDHSVLLHIARQFGTVTSQGLVKYTLRLHDAPIQVDWRIVHPRSFGAALCYFTGSKEHNIAMRVRAKQLGLLLNEYGLYHDGALIAGATEEGIYQALGVLWVPPEKREGSRLLDPKTGAAL